LQFKIVYAQTTSLNNSRSEAEDIPHELKAYIEKRFQEEKQKSDNTASKEMKPQFNLGGYFRTGSNFFAGGGAKNSGACFALSDASRNDGIFFRLGNECRDYGEFHLTHSHVKNSLEYKAVYTFDIASDSREARGVEPWANRQRQMYIEMTGSFLGRKNLWVGRRFYRAIGNIGDIHVLDGFQMQSSGNGFGVENVNFAGGRYHFALIGYGSSDPEKNIDEMNKFFDIRAQYFLSDSELQFGFQSLLTDAAPATQERVNGSTFTSQWKKRFGFLDNIAIFQYGIGSMAQNPGCFGSDGNCFNQTGKEGDSGFRLIENGTIELSPLAKIHFLILYEESQQFEKTLSYGIRPHYGFNDHVGFLGEFSINENQVISDGVKLENQKLYKATFSLQVTPDLKNFWERPSLRMYLSFFDWNEAALIQSAPTMARPGFSEATHATVYGVQGEIWF
jgi:maltoporin